jgi:hypothetical protein
MHKRFIQERVEEYTCVVTRPRLLIEPIYITCTHHHRTVSLVCVVDSSIVVLPSTVVCNNTQYCLWTCIDRVGRRTLAVYTLRRNI